MSHLSNPQASSESVPDWITRERENVETARSGVGSRGVHGGHVTAVEFTDEARLRTARDDITA